MSGTNHFVTVYFDHRPLETSCLCRPGGSISTYFLKHSCGVKTPRHFIYWSKMLNVERKPVSSSDRTEKSVHLL